MSPKNFIHKNEPFVCKHCQYANEKNAVGCRNHCSQCLYSLHVDQDVPGDRLSECNGLMEPIAYYHDSKKGYVLEHICSVCGKTMKNKLADDDNMATFLEYIEKRRIEAK